MKNNLQEVSVALYELGLAPLSYAEKERYIIDPRTSNFVILKRQIEALGFGDVLGESLWQQMRDGATKINLPYRTLIGEDTVACELQFTRSTNNNYFFNQYTVRLLGTEQNTNLPFKKQTIPVEYYNCANRSLSLEESYNLLKGKWVKKDVLYPDGIYYKDWQSYDFTMVNVSGNYRLQLMGKDRLFSTEQAIASYPLADYGKHKSIGELCRSLDRGNVEEINVVLAIGARVRLKVEANPASGKLNFYNGNRRAILSRQGELVTMSVNKPAFKQNLDLPGERIIEDMNKKKVRKRIKR